MLLRLLLLAAAAACLAACASSVAPAAAPAAPTAEPVQVGEITMAISSIIDDSTGTAVCGDVYLDDQLIAKDVSTATFSLGTLLRDRTVRVKAPGYLPWTVGVRRHNPSEAAHTIRGPVKLTPVVPHSPALPLMQG